MTYSGICKVLKSANKYAFININKYGSSCSLMPVTLLTNKNIRFVMNTVTSIELFKDDSEYTDALTPWFESIQKELIKQL